MLPLCGTYAEKVRVPEAWCFPIRTTCLFETGAAFGLVYQDRLLSRSFGAVVFREGDRVLVLGSSGGVGMAAVQTCTGQWARVP